jgi:uncharacterized membrane protein HdeD (DUF308 family)
MSAHPLAADAAAAFVKAEIVPLDHRGEIKMNSVQPGNPSTAPETVRLHDEFHHLRSYWLCFLAMGILLVVCATAAVIFPALTIITSFAAVVILGICLMVAGLATIITALWAGKWSGMFLQLLIGILYVMVGFLVTDRPGPSAVVLTSFVAAFFIVAGVFRIAAALAMRFTHWGWALLNGVVTLLCGVIIYRHFPESGLWVIGLLVALEMLFFGWSWIMLALAIRRIPVTAL